MTAQPAVTNMSSGALMDDGTRGPMILRLALALSMPSWRDPPADQLGQTFQSPQLPPRTPESQTYNYGYLDVGVILDVVPRIDWQPPRTEVPEPRV